MAFANNGDTKLFYESFGDPAREPLLMINGLGSQCIAYRDAWCQRFVDAGFFVTRFDNRDTGLSDGHEDAKADLASVVAAMSAGETPTVPYTLSDLAADAVAVLDALGVERAHVMGLSLGGMIAQTVAIEHQDRLLSLISVMSTTGDPDVGQSTDEARRRLLGQPATNREEYIANHIAGLRIWGSPGLVDEAEHTEFAGRAFDRAFRPSGPGRQIMATLAGGSRTPALATVTVPTLVMHGSADALIDPSGGRRTADAIPGARFVEIEGMGHDYPAALWDDWVALVADHAGVSA